MFEFGIGGPFSLASAAWAPTEQPTVLYEDTPFLVPGPQSMGVILASSPTEPVVQPSGKF